MAKECYKLALDSFIKEYKSDLIFIKYFNLFKSGQISFESYISKCPGNFRRFLYEFGVARNIAKGKVNPFLKDLKQFIHANENLDVDGLAIRMRNAGYTHQKIMTSLCSKVLFLNNPDHIIPIDRFAKKAIGYTGNSYKEFRYKLQDFTINHIVILKYFLNYVSAELTSIENDVGFEILDSQQLRESRYMDYLIWTIGKSMIKK